MDFDAKLAELGLTLPPAPQPVAVYKIASQVGNLLFLSGHGPLQENKTLITGKVGAALSVEEGKAAAKQTGLAMLATLKKELGSLNKIKKLVKTLAMVNCNSDFTEHPQVINGFSELMKEVFGDAGVGARSAVGMNSLPSDMSIEIECIFELND